MGRRQRIQSWIDGVLRNGGGLEWIQGCLLSEGLVEVVYRGQWLLRTHRVESLGCRVMHRGIGIAAARGMRAWVSVDEKPLLRGLTVFIQIPLIHRIIIERRRHG